MKNFFKKFKTYGFWVSLSAGIIVLLNALGRAFGFEIENQVVEDVIMSVASLLVILGVVSMGGKDQKQNSEENPENDDTFSENFDEEEVENLTENEEEKKEFLNEKQDDENQIQSEKSGEQPQNKNE